MPLYPNMEETIRGHLAQIRDGERVSVLAIGELTSAQHEQINLFRAGQGLPPLISPEILYLGRHHYNSRTTDGYNIEDMLAQIVSALDSSSVQITCGRGTTIENPNKRSDGYGNQVNDRAVLELTSRKPKAELFSVIPKGDDIKPPKNK